MRIVRESGWSGLVRVEKLGVWLSALGFGLSALVVDLGAKAKSAASAQSLRPKAYSPPSSNLLVITNAIFRA